MPTPTISRSVLLRCESTGLDALAATLDQSPATWKPRPMARPRVRPPDTPYPSWVPRVEPLLTELRCKRGAIQGSTEAPGVGTLSAIPRPSGTFTVFDANAPVPTLR